MSKLNPNAQKWVDALRSGKYQQARNALKNEVGHCCLGVACDISRIGKWSGSGYSVKGYSSITLLPIPVQDWLGLRDQAGTFKATHLAWENDHGATFEQIADMIEANADELGVSA